MVLEIRLSNFYSINEEVILNLRAGNINTKKAQELSDNVFSWQKEKILKTVSLHGPNASGKSNIIKAIRFCCRMILVSHLHIENDIFNFQPYKFLADEKPSHFFIRFILNDIEYEYSFSLTTTAILTESLFYYPNGRRTEIFSRDEKKAENKREKYHFPGRSVIKRPYDVAESTSHKSLYISRANQMDRTIGKEIYNFFSKNFILGYFDFNNQSFETLLGNYKDLLLDALQTADSDIIDIKYKKEKVIHKTLNFQFNLSEEEKVQTLGNKDVESKTLKIFTFHKFNPSIPFDFYKEESKGTQKLFYVLLNIIDIVLGNKILLIDEIEGSLHTHIVSYIIDLFHLSEHAQLIYTSHNTNLLGLETMRKDQIYFVDKNENGATEINSLYDYKDFREVMNVEKAYLQGRFDAIPFIDQSPSTLKNIIDG